MIINHNMSSIGAYRQLSANNASQTKSMEKLSSGLRINRAADDAAGLSISEKMRNQIRGLEQAQRNAQDGISLIQTAEGALGETHSILTRMRELAVQSSNDTNTSTDRSAIQKEMNQLTQEIDRISTATEYNTQKLLDGSFKGTFQMGANQGQTLDLSVSKMDSASLGLASGVKLQTVTSAGTTLKNGTYTIEGSALKDASGNEVGSFAGDTITLADGSTTIQFDKTSALAAGDQITISDNGDTATLTKKMVSGQSNTVLGPGSYNVVDNGGTLELRADNKVLGTVTGTTATMSDGGTLDLGAVFGMAAPADGDTFEVNGVDVSNKTMASGAISVIDDAIKKVSEERTNLGAYQNRIEYAINNLGTQAENATAAESRIRDVDMAKEVMQNSKKNILAQAAQAMLAQANQQPQGVLQLLR